VADGSDESQNAGPKPVTSRAAVHFTSRQRSTAACEPTCGPVLYRRVGFARRRGVFGSGRATGQLFCGWRQAAAGSGRGFDSDGAEALGNAGSRKLRGGLDGEWTACSRGVPREHATRRNNRARFVEFLGLEIPCFRPGYTPSASYGTAGTEGMSPAPESHMVDWRDRVTGKINKKSLGEVVYEIRNSFVHESENLDAAEGVDRPALLDWNVPNPAVFAESKGDRFILNGFFLWNRLRQVLAKFITGIESFNGIAQDGHFSICIDPALGSIVPTSRKGQSPDAKYT
jgi:hypothetical protein